MTTPIQPTSNTSIPQKWKIHLTPESKSSFQNFPKADQIDFYVNFLKKIEDNGPYGKDPKALWENKEKTKFLSHIILPEKPYIVSCIIDDPKKRSITVSFIEAVIQSPPKETENPKKPEINSWKILNTSHVKLTKNLSKEAEKEYTEMFLPSIQKGPELSEYSWHPLKKIEQKTRAIPLIYGRVKLAIFLFLS
ncbi:MAG: hypothetical protein WCP39_06720, partial [Chlamydiota bacterium]